MLSSLVSSLVVVDVSPITAWLLLLGDEEGNDEAVDAASLTQNDTDEVLGLDAGHFDHRAKDGGGGDHDTPTRSKKDAQARTHGYNHLSHTP